METNTKYRILRYTPTFVDRDEDPVIPFNTLDELLKVDFIHSSTTTPGFHRLAVARTDVETTYQLLVERNEGYEWWVLGYIFCDAGTFDLDLPEWKPRYKEADESSRL